MKKKFGAGCGAVVTGFILLGVFIMWATSGVTGAVDEFIEHLAQDRQDEAYGMLGSQVTTELKREAFEDFLVGTRLRKAQSGSWTQRSVENGEGRVSGTITLKDGGEISGRFYLEKTDGKWLIEGIHFDGRPTDSKETQDMEVVGSTFVDHLSKGEIDQAYAMFGDQVTSDLGQVSFVKMLSETSLDKTDTVEWASSKPANMGGVVKGTITTKTGDLVDIKLNLEKVADGWLIQGFNYKPQGGGGEVLPLADPKETLEWSKSFLAALASYMDSKDSKPMAALCHSKLAAKIADQDALAGVVVSFPDQPGLRKILDAPIVLTQKPDSVEGALHVEGRTEVQEQGHYLTYQLDFAVENGQWKISNLNLQTRFANDKKPVEAWKP